MLQAEFGRYILRIRHCIVMKICLRFQSLIATWHQKVSIHGLTIARPHIIVLLPRTRPDDRMAPNYADQLNFALPVFAPFRSESSGDLAHPDTRMQEWHAPFIVVCESLCGLGACSGWLVEERRWSPEPFGDLCSQSG